MVRTGLALLGVDPGNLPVGESPLRPVMSLRTQIVFLKDLPPSSPVGYNRTHVTRRRTRAAVIAAGYSDGIPYALGNRSYMLVRGERAPILGAVSMDYTTIDVSDIPGVSTGDEVTIVGLSGKRRIRMEDLARVIGTIPYELPTRLGRRVARVPVGA
jgi:alanine racemase